MFTLGTVKSLEKLLPREHRRISSFAKQDSISGDRVSDNDRHSFPDWVERQNVENLEFDNALSYNKKK